MLVSLIFTMLSTLHLDPVLSRLAGAFSAAGYAIVSVYIFVAYPEAAAGAPLVAYGTAISCTACLLLGGFAAGAVASQIRRHVVAALHDAEHRAKIAQFEHDLGMAQSIQQNLLPTARRRLSRVLRSLAGISRPTKRAETITTGSNSTMAASRSRSPTSPAMASAPPS